MVGLLKTPLYGCKQSAMLWFKHMKEYLVANNFSPSIHDETRFILNLPSGKKVWVLCYVDDLQVMSSNAAHLDKVVSLLHMEFKVNIVTDSAQYLGMNVARNESERTIKLSLTK